MLPEIRLDVVVNVYQAALARDIGLDEHGQHIGDASCQSRGCKVEDLTVDESLAEKGHHHDDGHDGQQPVAGGVHLQGVFSFLAQMLRCTGDELTFVLSPVCLKVVVVDFSFPSMELMIIACKST